jgi:hypothetical protein
MGISESIAPAVFVPAIVFRLPTQRNAGLLDEALITYYARVVLLTIRG